MRKPLLTYKDRKKNLYIEQIAYQLINNKNFVNRIYKLRRKWGIPHKGFKQWGEKADFMLNLGIKSELYYKSNEVIEKSKIINVKYGNFSENNNYNDWREEWQEVDDNTPIKLFYKDIKNILNDFNRSNTWKEFVIDFLFFNEMKNIPSSIPTLSINFGSERVTGEKEITIKINEYTRKNFMDKYFWNEVKRYQRKYLKQTKNTFKPLEDKLLKRNIHIYNEYLKGKSIIQINKSLATFFEKNFPTYYLENKDIFFIEDNQIRDIIDFFNEEFNPISKQSE